MITAQEALITVLNSAQDFGIEEIPFLKSVGSILKEEIFADRDFPPFNRVSMDGIVIDFAAFANGQRAFKIEKSLCIKIQRFLFWWKLILIGIFKFDLVYFSLLFI